MNKDEIVEGLQQCYASGLNINGHLVTLVKYFSSGSSSRLSYEAYLHQLKKTHGFRKQQRLF